MKASIVIAALQTAIQMPAELQAPRVGPLTRNAIDRLARLAPDEEYEWPVTPDLKPATLGYVDASGSTPSEISQAAVDLILESEGIDQPGVWPQGESGITLGFGVDIGADSDSLDYWRDELTPDEITRLRSAQGVTGERAGAIAYNYRDIKVTREMALRVFYRYTLPIETAKTKAAFPGAEQLPPNSLGALVSVVFNRGTSRKGNRRIEMQDIYDTLADGVQTGDLAKLAQDFRSMERLWRGSGLDGLITRRENEAKLIESDINTSHA